MLAGGIQVMVLAILLYTLSRAIRKSHTASAEYLPVTVVVCAHDEESNLRELVPRLMQQDYPDFEVIVVEDRSNDGTFDYLREAVKVYSNLRMVRVEHKPDYANGKKFGITLGIRAARNEWILLTDADCRPASDHWISSMAKQMTGTTDFVLGVSPYRKAAGLLNSFIRFETIVTALQYVGLATLGKPYMGVGRNLAYRKSIFLQHKGFADLIDTTGGDDDLFINRHAERAKTAVCVQSDGVMVSIPKASWREFLVQKLRHLVAGKRYKTADRLILGAVLISQLATWASLSLLLALPYPEIVLALFLLRWIMLMLLVAGPARRMGFTLEAWKVPLLDFIYAFYYLGTGLVALFSKRVRWKT